MSHTSISVAVFAALVAVGGVANADLSRGVISNFRGQLVISKDELPEGKNDKDTTSKIKAAQLKELAGTKNEDVVYWHFHYTAFLSKTGNTKLKLEFLKDGKLSADQSLDGIDAKSSVLSGDISINEDEGLAAGKTYSVQLLGAGDAVVAKATLTMNGGGK
jgi:HAMP domain-containing protein